MLAIRFKAERSLCVARCVISSFDITLVTMPEQVLVHLVQSRCVVASVELLRQEQARHSSVDSFSSVIHPRLGFVCFELLSAVEVLNHRGREENRPRAQPVHNACEPTLHACAPLFVYSRELGTKGS